MERAVKGLVDGRFQWVVFTSTNAVRAVWEKFAEFGLDARAFSGVKIACVGAATAEKVRAFGINPELVRARDFLMFASDHPHDHGGSGTAMLEAIDAEGREAITRTTAGSFYRCMQCV